MEYLFLFVHFVFHLLVHLFGFIFVFVAMPFGRHYDHEYGVPVYVWLNLHFIIVCLTTSAYNQTGKNLFKFLISKWIDHWSGHKMCNVFNVNCICLFDMRIKKYEYKMFGCIQIKIYEFFSLNVYLGPSKIEITMDNDVTQWNCITFGKKAKQKLTNV